MLHNVSSYVMLAHTGSCVYDNGGHSDATKQNALGR